MGDRANVVVVQSDGGRIWLYTHWAGVKLAADLARALKRGRERWDDPSYLARIIFCEMLPKENWSELAGIGIANEQQDNNHPNLVVDVSKTRVTCEDVDGCYAKYPEDRPCVGNAWSFEDFIAKFENDKKGV